MPEDRAHIIQKVLAELNIAEHERDPAMSDRLQESVSHVLQKLEPVLDEVSGESLCRIDSLSVEITLSKSKLHQLDEHLEKAIREKVMDSMKEVQASVVDTQKKSELERLTGGEKYQELLSGFLKTGFLPWWAEPGDLSDAEEWLSGLSANEWVSFAKPLVQDHPKAIRRLAAQLPETLIRELIQKSISGVFKNDRILQLRRVILQFFTERKDTGSISADIRSEFNERMIQKIFSGINEEDLMEEMLKVSMRYIADLSPESSTIENRIHSFKKYFEDSGFSDTGNKIEKVLKALEVSGMDTQSEFSETEPKKRSVEKESREKTVGIRVINAGLILMHPFLESFFKNLGFVDGGEFLNEAAQERAICLFHYLATGDEEFPEYELTLPKFLCGWPFDLPVKRYISLAEFEKGEAESLLLSCIDHWKALKNTSVEGLRENFLRRAGILRKEEFGWSLYVEQETHDILLQKIPWNLSVVKLKWMDEMLTIHWR